MMSRAVLVLAVAAALMGAPSPLLAAPPNRLSNASVTPATGTTLTPFVLSVRYTSDRGTPANSVLAEAGPVTVDLALTSGSATNGVWSGSTLLPLGTWAVTFRASADQGPQPSLAGPVLQVSGVTLASPSDSVVGPLPTEPAASSTPAPAPGATQASAGPSVDPRPARSGKPSAAASAEPAPARGGTGGTGGGSTGNASGGGGGFSAAPEPAANGSPGLAGAGAGASNDVAPRGSQQPPSDQPGLLEGHPDEPATASLLLLLGVIVSVAAVALLGTGWMLASRGRDDEPETSPGAASGRLASRGTTAATIEERRARRRAQRLPGHDPVLAALGLDADEPTAPTRGVARGASPRSRSDGRR